MSIPEEIGRYRILRELGRGGMAVVYLALDPEIKRRVAVKLLPRQFTFDPAFGQRFRQEAMIIASLEHPSIVPIYDFGVFDDQPFIVMRYMAGGSLSDLSSEGPLSLNAIEKIVASIAAALDKAHRQNIVHRDVKPDNVLFDPEGHAYLSDFGIARLAESSKTMTIVGTPAYMSPEQAQGDKQIDGRSDIYSLGVMLFELLSGRSPYEADTSIGLMMKHVMEPIPNILPLNPALSPDFQVLIDHALAKEPENRYPSAIALARDVTAVVMGKPIATQPPVAATVVDEWPSASVVRTNTPALPQKQDGSRFYRSLAIVGFIMLFLLSAGFAFLFRSSSNPAPSVAQETATRIDRTVFAATATQAANVIIALTASAEAGDYATSTSLATLAPPTTTSTTSPTPTTEPLTPTPTAAVIADLSAEAFVRVSEQTPTGVDTCNNTVTYGPYNLTDGVRETAWRVSGEGNGATASFDFGKEVLLTSINVLPGYDKRDPCETDIYWCSRYRIPSLIQLTSSNGNIYELALTNDCSWQSIEFDSLLTSSIELQILQSYPSRSAHHSVYTAISEVNFMGSE